MHGSSNLFMLQGSTDGVVCDMESEAYHPTGTDVFRSDLVSVYSAPLCAMCVAVVAHSWVMLSRPVRKSKINPGVHH